MLYNKTKRTLEKSAGIIGFVFSAIEFVTVIILIFYFFRLEGKMALLYLLPLIIIVPSLFFCNKVIESPIQKDGTIKDRTAVRVCVIIFSFLDGQWITFGFMIAVLCMKDFPKQEISAEGYMQNNELNKVTFTNEMEKQKQQLEELKKWKEEGIVSEEEYNLKRKQILGL